MRLPYPCISSTQAENRVFSDNFFPAGEPAEAMKAKQGVQSTQKVTRKTFLFQRMKFENLTSIRFLFSKGLVMKRFDLFTRNSMLLPRITHVPLPMILSPTKQTIYNLSFGSFYSFDWQMLGFHLQGSLGVLLFHLSIFLGQAVALLGEIAALGGFRQALFSYFRLKNVFNLTLPLESISVVTKRETFDSFVYVNQSLLDRSFHATSKVKSSFCNI